MSDRIVTVGIGATALLAAAVGMKIATTPGSPSQNEVAVVVSSPTASLPVILPMPQPQLLVVQAAPPPPPPAPEPPSPPEPRAAAPQIDVECTLENSASEPLARCYWDRGFPAISADGATLAVATDVDNTEATSLEVRFLDVASSRVIARDVIIDPKLFEDSGVLSDKQRAAVERRADRVQAKLVAGGYRSLAHVQLREHDDNPPSGLRAEVEGDRMRIVDLAANTVVFERRYPAEAAGMKPQVDADGEVYCTANRTTSIDAWWDASSRTLLTSVGYHNGGELCDWRGVEYAYRL